MFMMNATSWDSYTVWIGKGPTVVNNHWLWTRSRFVSCAPGLPKMADSRENIEIMQPRYVDDFDQKIEGGSYELASSYFVDW